MELASSMTEKVGGAKKSKSLDVLPDCGLQMLLVLPYNQSCTIYVPILEPQRIT